MEIKENIARIIKDKGMAAINEAYQLSIAKTDMLSELFSEGFSNDDIEEALMAMCDDGTLVLDDTHILLYDTPAP